MIKVFFELLEFIRTCAPLITSIFVFALFAVLFSKTIKKHATIFYIVFAIPFLMVAIPTIARWIGFEMDGFNKIPVLGEILRDYIHMGSLGHPLLVIIMYMGALSHKIPFVKKLMSIRKELSIISGFPILTHALIRVANNFPRALKYFTHHDDYIQSANVTSELGAGISNFSFVLGIILLALFLPLWITSFDSVHKRMGSIKWKKLQRWAYVLYACLFIHAMGMQVGGLLNPQKRDRQRPKTEIAASTGGGHSSAKGISDIEVNPSTKRYIHISSLLLIYGSYAVLRVRKAKKDNKKKLKRESATA